MKTINLLPKDRQEEMRYEAMLRGLWIVVNLTLVSFVVVFLVQFGLSLYLKFEAGSIKSQISDLQTQVNKQQNAGLKAQVQAANNLISDYTSLAAAAPKWSQVIKAFVPLVPAGVRINSFNVDPATNSISINGVSPTREQVIALYNNILNDSNDFYNIDYPLDNVIQPVNVDFHFDFFIQSKLTQ